MVFMLFYRYFLEDQIWTNIFKPLKKNIDGMYPTINTPFLFNVTMVILQALLNVMWKTVNTYGQEV